MSNDEPPVPFPGGAGTPGRAASPGRSRAGRRAERSLEDLAALPRRRVVWQGGLVRLPLWLKRKGEGSARAWCGAWVSVGLRGVNMGKPVPAPRRETRLALDAFIEMALDARAGGYLPERLEVAGPGVAELLSEALRPLGIEVVPRDRLPALDEVLQALAAEVGAVNPLPGILQPLGMTVERAASFAEAARLFYEAAPWRHLTDEDRIRVEAPSPRPGFEHLLVMGAGGLKFGLMLFESPELHEEILASDDPSAPFEKTQHASIFFGPITDLPAGDADLFEDHALPVADPSAYPWSARFKGTEARRMSVRDLAQVEAFLRALAATTEAEIDSGRWTRIVPTPEGTVTTTLALPDLLEEKKAPGDGGPRRLLDRRAAERVSAEIGRALAGQPMASLDDANRIIKERFSGRPMDSIPSTAATPAEQAQDLCYHAFDARGRRKVLLARQALALFPDCADAYVILAEQAGDREAELGYWRAGVEAGERTLGPGRLRDPDTRFWSDIGTRPYMRALAGLAMACANRGQHAEAVAHYQTLLRLNPDDNQGVRDPLAVSLLKMENHETLRALIGQFAKYPEAQMLYVHLLLDFREHGDGRAARASLRRALKENPRVPAYLLGSEELPPFPPQSYSRGGEDEAALVAFELREAWEETPGALTWLRKSLRAARPRSAGRLPRR